MLPVPTTCDKSQDIEKQLTRAEEQLIEVLRKPESVALPTAKICKLAKIDEKTYYRAFKKEHFLKAIQRECLGKIFESMLAVTQRVVSNAKEDTERHHWARMVLEIGKVYQPAQKTVPITDIKFIVSFARPDHPAPEISVVAETVDAESVELAELPA